MRGTRHAQVETTIGELTMVADGEDLVGLYFPGHWHLPPESAFGAPTHAEDSVFAGTRTELSEYFAGERQTFTVPLRARGDEFSERIWAMLSEIPFGARTTYGALAEQMGNRNLAQRVGQVVGRNPISILIPCHRVVGANGSLTGYAGGLDRKRWLLELEEPAEARESRLF